MDILELDMGMVVDLGDGAIAACDVVIAYMDFVA